MFCQNDDIAIADKSFFTSVEQFVESDAFRNLHDEVILLKGARAFGFGKNGDAFERWAKSIPLAAVGKHRDNLLQVEAVFFGQAGLLDDGCSKSAPDDDYYRRLQSEYRYLQKKFQTTLPLSPIDYTVWRFLRLRPQNFPHIRIAQLAMLYHEGRLNFSKIVEQANRLANDRFNHDIDRQRGGVPAFEVDFDGFDDLLQTHVSDYWQTHYYFSEDNSLPKEQTGEAEVLLPDVAHVVAPSFLRRSGVEV